VVSPMPKMVRVEWQELRKSVCLLSEQWLRCRTTRSRRSARGRKNVIDVPTSSSQAPTPPHCGRTSLKVDPHHTSRKR